MVKYLNFLFQKSTDLHNKFSKSIYIYIFLYKTDRSRVGELWVHDSHNPTRRVSYPTQRGIH